MTIVVVGHGRSPEGKGWGHRIDEKDVVVRMWDHEWQDPADYGYRYDYGVFAILPVSSKAFEATAKEQPTTGWIGYHRGRMEGELPAGTIVVGQEFRDRAAKISKYGRQPLNLTRGCVAACWAITREVFGDVILVGFDNLKAGKCLPVNEAFSPEYQEHYDELYPQWRKAGWYSPGQERCGSHDISVEKPLLEILAKENGVDLFFAEDAWA